VDSIVTDPPYELGFMGKKWDNSGIAYSVELWKECLRVLKPGGHLLSFGGTRTWHRVAVAIEDAGFDLRDSIAWMYGSGFPKSLDVSKAIDKQSGFQGEVIGTESVDVGMQGGSMHAGRETKIAEREIKQLSEEAEQWQGWGTALKPAFEPIVVARKPLIGTVAANVLEHGTGALNIDGSRIGTEKLGGGTMPDLRDVGRMSKEATGIDKLSFGQNSTPATRLEQPKYTGRWPANVILDEYSAGELDSYTGHLHAAGNKKDTADGVGDGYEASSYQMSYNGVANRTHNDSGGASRFFYCAKASKRDRNEGLENFPINRPDNRTTVGMGTFEEKGVQPQQNFHPTVKPTNLMRYLVKLVTPPNGTVLDPFTGSGSTGKAAILEGFDFIGIEMTEEYLPIIDARLKHAEQVRDQQEQAKDEGLF
jgi:site-specific DNA-methyltransferase (adenine-specific)